MSKVDTVLRRWRAQGVRLNVGASRERLTSLASLVGFSLPPDLTALYREADGMTDGEMDAWGVALWPIERVIAERDVKEVVGLAWFAFGDILINSWFLRMSPRSDRTLVLIESTGEVFQDLGDFSEAYIDRPQSLGLTRIGQAL